MCEVLRNGMSTSKVTDIRFAKIVPDTRQEVPRKAKEEVEETTGMKRPTYYT